MAEERKQYTGSCYIGVVGPENEIGECRDSIESITRRPKDSGPIFIRATKGYEARQMHLTNWYEKTKHSFMLLLDHDMKFPHNTLERLRSHRLPYVSGLYMRRRYAPIAPIWFEYGEAGRMPMMPWAEVPMPNSLYRIGASGWGCILIHRDVITAMRQILKGEPEIIEDDMDVYPYDTQAVMAALSSLDTATGEEARNYVEVLKREIRPLRGLKDPVGSDIRFPFYARLAGFDLVGDSGVVCDHMLNYPVSPNDYAGQSAATVRDIKMALRNDNAREAERIQKANAL
jgi:hypothetical protein